MKRKPLERIDNVQRKRIKLVLHKQDSIRETTAEEERKRDRPARELGIVDTTLVLDDRHGTPCRPPLADRADAVHALEAPRSQQPIGLPDVWANSQQELCETLPYYRSYHAGSYIVNDLVRGYLVDGVAAEGDYIGARVVISHAGGKAQGSRRDAALHSDQDATDRPVIALRNNLARRVPLVIIGGSKWTGPVELPHRYCVLGWFYVTDVWAERDRTGLTRYKVRFESIDPGAGWWSSSEQCTDLAWAELSTIRCRKCGATSPRIYSSDLCLSPDCSHFWRTSGDTEPVFRRSAPIGWSDSRSRLRPSDAVPPALICAEEYHSSNDSGRANWRGFHCKSCGKLNCRISWLEWVCSHCGDRPLPRDARTVVRLDQVASECRTLWTGVPIVNDHVQPGWHIDRREWQLDRCICIVAYTLGDAGTVFHIRSNAEANKLADRLFEDYQRQHIDMRRRPMVSAGRIEGTMLCQQFQHNAGARYKFICAVDTEPLDACAPVIREALAQIERLTQLALGQVFTKRDVAIEPSFFDTGSDLTPPPDEFAAGALFNELLSIAYMDGQKMDYHDDGERDVGETVASISLGADATLKFRPKDPHTSPLRGKEVQVKSDRSILKLELEHGDVCIMHGRHITSTHRQ